MLPFSRAPVNARSRELMYSALIVMRLGWTLLLVALPALTDYAQGGQIGKWLPKVEEWIAAVHAHEAGRADDAAKRIAQWSNEDLDFVLPHVHSLVQIVADEERATDVRSPIEREQLQRLARGIREKGSANRFAMRGAMLHSDVMMLGLAPELKRINLNQARREQKAKRPVMVIGVDGQYDSFAIAQRHWPFARGVVSAVPAASRDDMLRRWFHVTSAYLLVRSRWGEARLHLLDAQAMFRDDPQIAFDLGCLYEARAAPRVQAVQQSARTFSIDLGSVRVNLTDAEERFTRAIELDPTLSEARVRRARVKALLGRNGEAAVELRVALNSSSDPVVRYYARLFLGDAEQALGHRELAVEQYRAAAALYPGAQAPHLALGVLARETGDRQASLFALQHFLGLPTDERTRRDPWWSYYTGSGRHIAALIKTLWRSAAGGSTP